MLTQSSAFAIEQGVNFVLDRYGRLAHVNEWACRGDIHAAASQTQGLQSPPRFSISKPVPLRETKSLASKSIDLARQPVKLLGTVESTRP